MNRRTTEQRGSARDHTLTEALALLIVDLYGKMQPTQTTTLDDLAAMINHGFTEAQKHTDAQLAALRGELIGVMTDMAEELTATHEDVRAIRTTVNLLVRNDAAQDAARVKIPFRRRPEERNEGAVLM